MKAFLVLRARKSVSEKLADFLILIIFGFLVLADFAIVDTFLILPPTLPSVLLILSILADIS